MNPKFTIITTSFNASGTISATIMSVLDQNYDLFEYLVIDGESTDGTVEILQEVRDRRFSYISEPDKGIYDAMNKGLKMATGDFVLFLGADDRLYDSSVLLNVAHKISDISSVYYGDVILSSTEARYAGEFSKVKWGYTNLCHQSVFYPLSVYTRYRYDTSYQLVADWEYNLHLISDNVTFRYLDEVISIYDDVDGASSLRNDELFLKNRRRLTVDAVGFTAYCSGLIIKLWKKISVR